MSFQINEKDKDLLADIPLTSDRNSRTIHVVMFRVPNTAQSEFRSTLTTASFNYQSTIRRDYSRICKRKPF